MWGATSKIPLPLNQQTLAELTHQQFSSACTGDFSLFPIEKGGSLRLFYRFTLSEGTGGGILIHYHPGVRENLIYAQINRFLKQVGVTVPSIHAEDLRHYILWVEDAGERDLHSFRQLAPHERIPRYQAALRELATLHAIDPKRPPVPLPDFEKGFSFDLYRWEQSYFFEHCLLHFFAWQKEEVEHFARQEFFLKSAERLGASAPAIVHRDFQSTNIILKENKAYIIDFQGMRLGHPEYDLASLLYDPYVDLTLFEREELRKFYRQLLQEKRAGTPIHRPQLEDEEETFYLCALHRLMQALGAYGNLGLNRPQPRFLEHILPALQSLSYVSKRWDELSEFSQLLECCIQKYPGQLAYWQGRQ